MIIGPFFFFIKHRFKISFAAKNVNIKRTLREKLSKALNNLLCSIKWWALISYRSPRFCLISLFCFNNQSSTFTGSIFCLVKLSVGDIKFSFIIFPRNNFPKFPFAFFIAFLVHHFFSLRNWCLSLGNLSKQNFYLHI